MCVQHASGLIGDHREGAHPDIHTDPRLVAVLRTAPLVMQLGGEPVTQTVQRPRSYRTDAA
jgi:hypothetical protein